MRVKKRIGISPYKKFNWKKQKLFNMKNSVFLLISYYLCTSNFRSDILIFLHFTHNYISQKWMQKIMLRLQHAAQQWMQACTADSSQLSQEVTIAAHKIFLIRARWFGIWPIIEIAIKRIGVRREPPYIHVLLSACRAKSQTQRPLIKCPKMWQSSDIWEQH